MSDPKTPKPPKPATEFNLAIITPDEVLFEDTITRLIAPGATMDLAILPNHTPLYAQIKPGTIRLITASGEKKTFPIESGLMRVKNNQAILITGFDTPAIA